MNPYSYYKTAALTPEVYIGDPKANVQEMLKLLYQLDKDCRLAVFPELCISGYTCQDLFYESLLQKQCLEALGDLADGMPKNMAVVAGLPLKVKNKLYNTAAFLFNGKVLGFYVKRYLPMYNEYYETRWFSSSDKLEAGSSIRFRGEDIPVSNKILFEDVTTGAVTGIEICEDLWVSIPVSSHHAQAGANILVNPSASNEVIAKDAYRKALVENQSARLYAAYIYASAGSGESSMDLVFSGMDLIAENGKILASSSLMDPKPFIQAQIDLEVLENDRIKYKTSFEENPDGYVILPYATRLPESIELERDIDPYPFVPSDLKARVERCQQILTLQARGLATRLKKIHCSSVVIGISGGLDSTLALLVCKKAFDILGLDPKGIHAITMPGFGTTSRTKNNADELMELLHTSSQEISIARAARGHLEDIGHDESIHDITYENAQARERTQILMDLANKYNGIVIGTGDLSELALGWCTYNGDHMSMYAVNVSVPKTLVRYIVESEAIKAGQEGNHKLEQVLLDICDTPVSPELLPPDASGNIQQKTEESIGKYDLHDFFLYHLMRHHESPKKIFDLACKAFQEISREEILKSLRTFYWRFFAQQFKRNVMPDGVKVGSVNFSPRGDWRMPSDASKDMWLKELDKIRI